MRPNSYTAIRVQMHKGCPANTKQTKTKKTFASQKFRRKCVAEKFTNAAYYNRITLNLNPNPSVTRARTTPTQPAPSRAVILLVLDPPHVAPVPCLLPAAGGDVQQRVHLTLNVNNIVSLSGELCCARSLKPLF